MNDAHKVGRLTSKPELNISESGKKYCRFSIAEQKSWKDEEGKLVVQFPKCVAFGTTAEFICNYMDKGDQIELEAESNIERYTNKDGIAKETTTYKINNIRILEKVRSKDQEVIEETPVLEDQEIGR